MIYGYVRCSTNETKQNVDRQIRDIKKMVDNKEMVVFSEYESGTKVDRKELNKLLSIIKEGDTIVCTEASRISRSTKQLIDIIEYAKSKKFRLLCGNLDVDCTKEQLDPMVEGMLKIMGVVGEMERNMISQRVRSGMENAKAKGKKIGRATTTKAEIEEDKKFMKFYKEYAKGKMNVTDLANICEMSRTTVYKYIKILKDA